MLHTCVNQQILCVRDTTGPSAENENIEKWVSCSNADELFFQIRRVSVIPITYSDVLQIVVVLPESLLRVFVFLSACLSIFPSIHLFPFLFLNFQSCDIGTFG
jgi:hypothetical protein